MDITSGGYRVLNSGLVFTFKDQAIIFDIDPQLKITISFRNDETVVGQRVESTKHSNTHGELTCINFNETLGTGYIDPIIVGNIGDESVYLYFWISKIGKDSIIKRVDYTWFIGKDADGI